MVSFVNYVLSYKNEANGCGDVARDMLMDPGLNRRWGYRKLMTHIYEKYNPSLDVCRILSDLSHSYAMNR